MATNSISVSTVAPLERVDEYKIKPKWKPKKQMKPSSQKAVVAAANALTEVRNLAEVLDKKVAELNPIVEHKVVMEIPKPAKVDKPFRIADYSDFFSFEFRPLLRGVPIVRKLRDLADVAIGTVASVPFLNFLSPRISQIRASFDQISVMTYTLKNMMEVESGDDLRILNDTYCPMLKNNVTKAIYIVQSPSNKIEEVVINIDLAINAIRAMGLSQSRTRSQVEGYVTSVNGLNTDARRLVEYENTISFIMDYLEFLDQNRRVENFYQSALQPMDELICMVIGSPITSFLRSIQSRMT